MDAFIGRILSCLGFIPQLGILGDVPFPFPPASLDLWHELDEEC